jgi:hypothetical protein
MKEDDSGIWQSDYLAIGPTRALAVGDVKSEDGAVLLDFLFSEGIFR